MHLSIIIPAFNEERLIEHCLCSVSIALAANARPNFSSEVIVVDNNSTDATADLARQAGAQVVFEPVNQIGRARNAGAAVATGDWLLFVDADCVPVPDLTDRYFAARQSAQRLQERHGGARPFDRLGFANEPLFSLLIG